MQIPSTVSILGVKPGVQRQIDSSWAHWGTPDSVLESKEVELMVVDVGVVVEVESVDGRFVEVCEFVDEIICDECGVEASDVLVSEKVVRDVSVVGVRLLVLVSEIKVDEVVMDA